MSTAERTGRQLTPGQTTWLSTVFAVVIGGLLWLSVAQDQWQSARTLFWADLALGVASLAAMQCRRRWPFAVTVPAEALTSRLHWPTLLLALGFAAMLFGFTRWFWRFGLRHYSGASA